jgi:carboxypeptidase family protein
MIAGRRVAVWALSLVVFCSCDPRFQLSGRVTDTRGAPVPGAKVWLGDRPHPWLEAVSDQRGLFREGGIGALRDELEIEIGAPGFYPVSTRVGDHCFKHLWLMGGGCVNVRLEVSLTASRTPRPAP